MNTEWEDNGLVLEKHSLLVFSNFVGIASSNNQENTYDHRLVRTGHPVRSAILKHQIGRLVVEWVTISESLLLYVNSSFAFF